MLLPRSSHCSARWAAARSRRWTWRARSSIPHCSREAPRRAQQGPNFATLFAQMATQVERDSAREAGLKLLEWLAKVPAGSERNIAVNLTTSALKQALGEEKYSEALRGNVVSAGVAQGA